jgi:hypothetical protein
MELERFFMPDFLDVFGRLRNIARIGSRLLDVIRASCRISPAAHQMNSAPIHVNLPLRRKQFGNHGGLICRVEGLVELGREVGRLTEDIPHNRPHTRSSVLLSKIADLCLNSPLFPCHGEHTVCVVHPEGEVVLCHGFGRVQPMRDMPHEEFWRGEAFQVLREWVRRCQDACRSTLDAEASVRRRRRSIASGISRTWKDIAFYFKENKP